MNTIVVPVYPSQLDAFKAKADLLAEKIKQSLNIKVSKFKRYEYLARGIGHVKGHDRLIENAKRIAQADKHEPLLLFSDPVICNQIGTVFKFHHNQDIAREVQEICKVLATHEVIMANTISHLILKEEGGFYSTDDYKRLRQQATGGSAKESMINIDSTKAPAQVADEISQIVTEDAIKEHVANMSTKPRSGLVIKTQQQMFLSSTGTIGEQFAGRFRGEEFEGILEQSKSLLTEHLHELTPALGETYLLRELANFLYFQMSNTNDFSSLDLAGWLIDNSRKVGVSVIHNIQEGPDNELKVLDKQKGLFAIKDDKGFNQVILSPQGSGRSALLPTDTKKSI